MIEDVQRQRKTLNDDQVDENNVFIPENHRATIKPLNRA